MSNHLPSSIVHRHQIALGSNDLPILHFERAAGYAKGFFARVQLAKMLSASN